MDAQVFNEGVRKLTDEEKINIRILSELNPFKPATKIQDELFLDCDIKTVRRVMKEEIDLHCFTPT